MIMNPLTEFQQYEEKLIENIKLNDQAHSVLSQILDLVHEQPDNYTVILSAFTHKAIDLYNSILILQKERQMESAQALVRCLFETNLKFCHFVEISTEHGQDYACQLVRDSAMIIKNRDAIEQEIPSESIASFKKTIKEIEKNYQELELKKIKTNGFSMLSTIELAKKYNKKFWYDSMYRSFSRNVHSHDMTEYIAKQTLSYNDDYFKRDMVALTCAHHLLKTILEFWSSFFAITYDETNNKGVK